MQTGDKSRATPVQSWNVAWYVRDVELLHQVAHVDQTKTKIGPDQKTKKTKTTDTHAFFRAFIFFRGGAGFFVGPALSFCLTFFIGKSQNAYTVTTHEVARVKPE